MCHVHSWRGITDSWEQRKSEMAEMRERFEVYGTNEKIMSLVLILISMMATKLDSKLMSSEEYMGNVILLIVGGNDTTRNSLSGSVLALNKFPDENKKLRENSGLILLLF